MDVISQGRLRLLYPDVSVRVNRLYSDIREKLGLEPRVAQGLRTFEQQKKLYDQGRTEPGKIVTNAKPGSSFHNFGCAVDTCFIGPDPFPADEKIWKRYGELAKAHGFVWGGDFHSIVDRPHIELSYGLTLSQVRALYSHNGLKAVWAEFDRIRGVKQGSEWDTLVARTQVLDLGKLPDELC